MMSIFLDHRPGFSPKLPENRWFRTVPLLASRFFHHQVRSANPLKSTANPFKSTLYAIKLKNNELLVIKIIWKHILRIRRFFNIKWPSQNSKQLLHEKIHNFPPIFLADPRNGEFVSSAFWPIFSIDRNSGTLFFKKNGVWLIFGFFA